MVPERDVTSGFPPHFTSDLQDEACHTVTAELIKAFKEKVCHTETQKSERALRNAH